MADGSENKSLKKNGRGGRRKGAGRPRGDSRIYSFRLGGTASEMLDSVPGKTAFIRGCVERGLNGIAQASALSWMDERWPAAAVRPLTLPFFDDVRVVAGFPVPLDADERAQDIELLSMLCPHPESSYLVRIKGDSMIDAGVANGDIVIVDKSRRDPGPREIAVCELNGEFTLKRISQEEDGAFLVPANPDYPRIPVRPEDRFSVWGTVTYIIHKPRG